MGETRGREHETAELSCGGTVALGRLDAAPLPELPIGRYFTQEEYEIVADHLAREGLAANGWTPEQIEEIMAGRH